MEDREILEIAKKLAKRFNIQIKNEQRILKNMQPEKNPITTILYNKGYTIWIDKYYIAYSNNNRIDVLYVFITKRHISEELRQIKKMIKKNCSFVDFIMLSNINAQMIEALNTMNAIGESEYIKSDLSLEQ